MKLSFLGIDPSLTRTGVAIYNEDDKRLVLAKIDSDRSCKAFDDVIKTVKEISDRLRLLVSERVNDYNVIVVSMETPPPNGMFSSGLWGLDISLALRLMENEMVKKLIALNPTFIGHIHGKRSYTKTESVELAKKVVDVFISEGVEIVSDKRVTHDSYEALIMLCRGFYKFSTNKSLKDKIEAVMPKIIDDKGYKIVDNDIVY